MDELKAKIIEARLALLNRIIEICENPKPNYSIEGQSVSHGDFLKNLLDALKQLEEFLNIYDPYWHESVVA